VNLRLLCPTRWTARHGAFEAVLKDYSTLMDTIEDINMTTHDDYGAKAGGILRLMEKFSTLFGIELEYQVFGISESLSKTLKYKDISFQEAIAAVNLAKSFYKRMRKEDFNRFYERVMKRLKMLRLIPLLYQGIEEFPEGWIMAVLHISLQHIKIIFVLNTIRCVICC